MQMKLIKQINTDFKNLDIKPCKSSESVPSACKQSDCYIYQKTVKRKILAP
jgi:hypothetical protein